MGNTFTVKDSGARQDYDSGLRRDTTEGKADYTLIPRFLWPRWAQHMLLGAVKYGRENWKKAGGSPDSAQEELERFQSSALRHMLQWLDGETDEDHACAVLFNVSVAEHIADRVKNEDYDQDALWMQAKKIIADGPWEPATQGSVEASENGIVFSRSVTAAKVRDCYDCTTVRYHEKCPSTFGVRMTNLNDLDMPRDDDLKDCDPGDCTDAR